MSRTFLAFAGTLALAGCGKAATESDNPQPVEPAESAAAAPTAAAAAAETPAAFLQCKTCHSVEPGRHQIGPSLAGIHGQPAASAPGYAYSVALKGAGLKWDDATLDRFLAAPMATVTGTKMVYPGLKDPAKRAEVVAYLKTL